MQEYIKYMSQEITIHSVLDYPVVPVFYHRDSEICLTHIAAKGPSTVKF